MTHTHVSPSPATASTASATGRAGGSTGTLAAQLARETLARPGRPLSAPLQEEYGARFGFDFSKVRIHTDERAAQSATALHASAYTHGRCIAFAPYAFDTGTRAGRQLLAHELAHVVQQNAATPSSVGSLAMTSAAEEREAERAAETVATGGSVSVRPAAGPRLGRAEPPGAESGTAAEKPSELPLGRYVDLFEEVIYDISYLPDQPGLLSNWLQVKYADGTQIDISINEFSETGMSLQEAGRAMADETVGRGGRIFPSALNPTTTPRLFAARKSALEIMEQFNYDIALASTGIVMFIITAGAPLLTLGAEGAPPLPVSSWRRAPPALAPAAARAAAQTVEELVQETLKLPGSGIQRYFEFARRLSSLPISSEAKAMALKQLGGRFGIEVGGLSAKGGGRFLVIAKDARTAFQVAEDGMITLGKFDMNTMEVVNPVAIRPLAQ